MDLPVAISTILHQLQSSGFAAYIVGGSVRDYFLGRKQQDFDIATSATPEQVMKLFPKTIPTGLKHGTVTVIVNGMHCEVTTFRIDLDYDGRRPGYVKFTAELEEDLKRRDFTINAIAYDGRRFFDPLGGISDIQLSMIRAVGEAKLRFQEDYLRMLRAVRFAAQLGFTIEEQTKQAIIEQAENIVHVSMERIRDELSKILLSNNPSLGLELFAELRLLKPILPEIFALNEEKYRTTLQLLQHTKPFLIDRLCALCYFIDDVRSLLNRLKYDRKTILNVGAIVQQRNVDILHWTKYHIKKQIQSLGNKGVVTLIDLHEILGTIKDPVLKKAYDQIKHDLQEIIQNQEPIFLKDLAINGQDLKSIGFPEGAIMGDVLRKLLDLVLMHPEYNQKEQLLRYAEQIKNSENLKE